MRLLALFTVVLNLVATSSQALAASENYKMIIERETSYSVSGDVATAESQTITAKFARVKENGAIENAGALPSATVAVHETVTLDQKNSRVQIAGIPALTAKFEISPEGKIEKVLIGKDLIEAIDNGNTLNWLLQNFPGLAPGMKRAASEGAKAELSDLVCAMNADATQMTCVQSITSPAFSVE